jgi:hypothetical protein
VGQFDAQEVPTCHSERSLPFVTLRMNSARNLLLVAERRRVFPFSGRIREKKVKGQRLKRQKKPDWQAWPLAFQGPAGRTGTCRLIIRHFELGGHTFVLQHGQHTWEGV